MVIEFGSYQLDDEPTRVDRDAVWSFLSGEAYWARWRTGFTRPDHTYLERSARD